MCAIGDHEHACQLERTFAKAFLNNKNAEDNNV